MNSSALASRAASTISSSVAPRAAEGDVLPHRAAEQHGVLQHEADLPTQRVQLVVADVDAVDPDGPGVGVAEPRDEADDRRLSAAGGAHDADHLTRRDPKADVAEHREVRVVAEGHVFELDLAGQRRRLDRVGPLGHHVVSFEDRPYALEADRHLCDRIGQDRHVAHRLEEPGEIGQEDRERTHGRRASQHQNRTAPQHDTGAHRHGQADHRGEQGGHPPSLEPGGHRVGAGADEVLLLQVLAVEGLDDLDALQSLLKGGRQVGLALADFPRRILDQAVDTEDEHREERHHRQCDQRKVPSKREHHDDHPPRS